MKKIVRYSKSIYSSSSILWAIKAYKNICDIKANEDVEYIVCTFETTGDVAIIVGEFGNYLIELMQ